MKQLIIKEIAKMRTRKVNRINSIDLQNAEYHLEIMDKINFGVMQK